MSEDFFRKICTSHFIVRVRKGLIRVLLWEAVGDWTKTAIYWPPLLWPSALCLSRFPGLLNRRPRGTLCWLSLPHLISNFSGPQLIRGPKGPIGLVWISLPHLFSNSNRSLTVLTELYNSSTATPSLEWHVWSSSSGNNCHAVQRSLSSGASVYEVSWAFFTLSHFVSQARLHNFLS